MFAQTATRLAGLLWDGVDLAVDFATLGEYRLPDRPAGEEELGQMGEDAARPGTWRMPHPSTARSSAALGLRPRGTAVARPVVGDDEGPGCGRDALPRTPADPGPRREGIRRPLGPPLYGVRRPTPSASWLECDSADRSVETAPAD